VRRHVRPARSAQRLRGRRGTSWREWWPACARRRLRRRRRRDPGPSDVHGFASGGARGFRSRSSSREWVRRHRFDARHGAGRTTCSGAPVRSVTTIDGRIAQSEFLRPLPGGCGPPTVSGRIRPDRGFRNALMHNRDSWVRLVSHVYSAAIAEAASGIPEGNAANVTPATTVRTTASCERSRAPRAPAAAPTDSPFQTELHRKA
jgi:hypothetical protein